ncbi:MAG: hypothetical protein HDQ99_05680 [Lachnospiraceae bacterium]|nr:hypothetical protein [Lachnospiraceae bacterium]
MIDVKLNLEEYNKLFGLCLYEDDNSVFCKVQDDYIIFLYDPESDDAIASVHLNTPEGKILSNYTECRLRITVSNNNGDIFISKSCMNPDDQYLGHCYNCFVNHCQSSYSCRKNMLEKIHKLDKNINDLRFIDPIPNRDYGYMEKIRKWEYTIMKLSKDFFNSKNDDIQKIYETVQLLHNQMETLQEEWRY